MTDVPCIFDRLTLDTLLNLHRKLSDGSLNDQEEAQDTPSSITAVAAHVTQGRGTIGFATKKLHYYLIFCISTYLTGFVTKEMEDGTIQIVSLLHLMTILPVEKRIEKDEKKNLFLPRCRIGGFWMEIC
ncbi:hypothetical protein ACJX0J_018674 [Zea mays]